MMGDGSARQAMGERMAEAIERAVGLSRSPAAIAAARDAAQVVGLVGLERLLAALSRLAGDRWPGETLPVRDRLLRLARACRAEQGIEPLEQGDHQLAALAAEIESLEWSVPAATTAVVTMDLADVVGGSIARSGGPELEAVRLTAPVGAAFKAVWDWLSAPDTRMKIRLEAGVLEIAVERPDPTAIVPSGRLLGAVGGCLVPTVSDAGTVWRVRLPTVVERPSFLIVRQGELSIALPWQSVAGIHIANRAGEPVRASELPRLEPVVPLGRASAQPVVVIVASGLRRARFVADRIVWRFPAAPHGAGAPPSLVLEGAVQTDDGEVHWVANPERLLAGVPEPALEIEPPPAPTGGPHPQAEGTPSAPEDAQTEPGAPVELTEADVEPLEAPDAGPAVPPAVESPVVEPPGAGRAERAPGHAAPIEPARPPVPSPRALIADDALMARRFLARLLEDAGFEVQAVSRAADLFEALRSRWDLVLVDVELPDGRGADLLKGVLERHRGNRPAVVALVRDATDRRIATEAGIERALRKPFDRENIVSLLFDLGLEADRRG